MDEIDLIAKIPPSFEEMIESKKWLERKEAIEGLISIVEKCDSLDSKSSYHRLCDQLKQVIAKDANINVAAAAAKLVTLIANKLGNKFKDYGTPFVSVIFEKFKEKKVILRDALCESIDAIGKYISFDNIIDDIVKAMEKPNPAQKSQIDLFFSRYLSTYRAVNAPKKIIKAITPILAKHCSDPDSEVRESAMTCLGVLMFVIGEKDLIKMVGDLSQDSLKWTKIQETKEETEKKAKEIDDTKGSVKSKNKSESENEDYDNDELEQVEEKEIDPFDELSPVDVISKLPDSFFTDVESKKWTERRDALQALLDLCNNHKKLDPKSSFGDIVPILKRVLEKDANINVAALSAKCLSAFAYGLRQKFGPYVLNIASVIFEKFKEKKPILRDPLIELIDNIVAYSCPIESLQEDICTALDKQNPNIKAQVSLFLQRVFKTKNSTTLPKKFVKEVSPFLIKITGVSDPEARDSACAALGALQRIIGEKAMNSIMGDAANDKIKMAKIKEFCEKMIEENGPAVSEMVQSIHKADVKKKFDKKVTKKVEVESEIDEEPMKPLPKTVLSCNEMDENDRSSEKKGLKKKKPLGTKNTKSPTSTSESTNLETVLSSNSNKNQRFKDEAKLKLLKWQFEVPQPEHLQQLQSQLKEVVSIDLFNKLYNKDFKQQLKALDTLISVCDSDPEAIIVNSDLLFKWITLRILETNPSVLMKCLEFGQCISEVYKQKDLMLHDVELSSFLPFLLLKTGETKEPIRIAVKKLVFDICDITSVSKVYGFLVEALKTKNSRMKTECLNIMENIIDNCYENVIGSHSASFKLIASSISDRDNNVRTAALNCFVAAYRSVGTEIYKLAGKLPDKDKAYLEERIKRSGVKEIGQRATSLPGRAKIVKPVATPIVTPNNNIRNEMSDEDNAYQQNENYNELNNDIKNSRKSMQVVEDVYDVDIDAEFPDLDINASKEASTRVTSSINVLGNKIELGNKEVYNKRELLKPKLDLKLYSNHINNIDQILYAVTSNDVKKASEGISDLFVILNNRDNFPIEVIQYKIDDIIICICRAIDIYKDNFTIQTPIPDDISTFCKNIFNLLLCTMNNQEYIETIKPETVCFFLSTVLGCVSRSFVSSNDLWKNSIHHSLNHATVKLCDNCNYNTMMIGIADCMAAHTGNNFNDKVFNLARKCMDKLSTMTTKKNNEWDAEVCLSSMNRIMKLFPTAQDKIYETTFHAIRNHIQRLIVVNKSKVRDAVSRNQHSKDKVWQYAARCLEKVMPTEIAKLDSTIMKINGMTNDEIVKLLSNIPIISCEWDAFFESAKSQDTGLVDLVIEGIKEKDPFLYQSCYRKFNLSKSLKPGCGKLWTKNILLVDSVYLNKSRIDHHMNRFKKSQEILDLVLVNKCPTRAQSIPHLNHTVITKNSIHLSSSSSALNQQSNEVQTPVSQYKKPKRLSALDRENLKEKLAQIRGL